MSHYEYERELPSTFRVTHVRVAFTDDETTVERFITLEEFAKLFTWGREMSMLDGQLAERHVITALPNGGKGEP